MARCSAKRPGSHNARRRISPAELVVKVDRSGLNEHHPVVERLYGAIDRVLRRLPPRRNAAPAPI
jgi:hypothetical protein